MGHGLEKGLLWAMPLSVQMADGTTKIFRRSKLGCTSNQYKIVRTYYRHSVSPDFSRIIVTIYGKYMQCYVCITN